MGQVTRRIFLQASGAAALAPTALEAAEHVHPAAAAPAASAASR